MLYLLSSVFSPLSTVFYLLPSILCLQSSILYILTLCYVDVSAAALRHRLLRRFERLDRLKGLKGRGLEESSLKRFQVTT